MTGQATGPNTTAAREAALDLMGDVLVDHRLLAEVLPRRLARLAAAERARAQRLARVALRVLDRSDRMLGPHLRKRPPARVMNLLRLGVAEICAEGAPAHGVVNAAVEIARAHRQTAGMAGLVNAVLRKVAGETANWETLPVPRLPKWLRKPLIDDYGKPVVEAMEAVQAVAPPLDLTAKGDAGDLAARLGADLLPNGSVRLAAAGQVSALPGFDAGDLAARLGGDLLPNGSVRLAAAGQVSALPGFDAGSWWVQDAAAAMPARVLDAKPGELVLDLCAAPGGKTMQLAATGAEVTAVDISPTRMARVAENLARTGLSAELVTVDARDYRGGPFDAILLDAPCSATGTLRRHPDLPHAKDGSDFPALFALQEALIDHALGMLKPGGRLVYCTCSLLIDEGEEQLRDACARHPELTVDRAALARPGIDPAWIGAEGGLRLRPDFWAGIGGLDGFYIACLRRP